jgi:hypothetical protein
MGDRLVLVSSLRWYTQNVFRVRCLAQPFGINRTNMLLHDGAMKGVTAP